MCAAVFLSLKNTPLAYITPYSYERINILHKTAGMMTTFWVVAHPLVWLGTFASSNSLSAFRQQEQIYGAIAGVSFLILGPVAAMFRLVSYELFYVTHVTFIALAIIMTALHRPEFAYKTIIVTIVTGSLWAADKLFRWTRFLLYSVNNTATLTPLPNGGTRVELAKTPIGAAPGKHIFLWIPGVRSLQMHPFSIISTHPLELVINSYSGFTKALHKKARENPGIVLRASMEGPYGKFPDPLDYDKIVLIAGGSGGSFTFGLAVNALERMTAESRQEIEFVWAVRETGESRPRRVLSTASLSDAAMTNTLRVPPDHLSWYQDHLKTLLTHEHAPKVKTSLHITQGDPEKPPTWESTPVASALSSRTSVDYMSRLTVGEVDDEKRPTAGRTASSASSVLLAGRPDVAAQIRDAVRTTPKDKRILVAACGPNALMTVVRNTTASCIEADGPSIEMHLEQFGW